MSTSPLQFLANFSQHRKQVHREALYKLSLWHQLASSIHDMPSHRICSYRSATSNRFSSAIRDASQGKPIIVDKRFIAILNRVLPFSPRPKCTPGSRIFFKSTFVFSRRERASKQLTRVQFLIQVIKLLQCSIHFVQLANTCK